MRLKHRNSLWKRGWISGSYHSFPSLLVPTVVYHKEFHQSIGPDASWIGATGLSVGLAGTS